MAHRTLEVEARLDSLRAVGDWMAEAARQERLPYDVFFGLDLAVHEAVENVVRHGQREGAAHRIWLNIRVDARRAEVVIEDDAPSFDPLSVVPRAVPLRLEDVVPGGQGVRLMRHFTDEIQYRREGGRNVLTLLRTLVSPSEEA